MLLAGAALPSAGSAAAPARDFRRMLRPAGAEEVEENPVPRRMPLENDVDTRTVRTEEREAQGLACVPWSKARKQDPLCVSFTPGVERSAQAHAGAMATGIRYLGICSVSCVTCGGKCRPRVALHCGQGASRRGRRHFRQ